MFAKSTRSDRNAPTQVEYTEPLLGSREDLHADRTVFAVDDSDDEDEGTALHTSKSDHSVRFHEEVQVLGPPLRSTLASREAEFELDSDEVDDTHDDINLPTRSSRSEQSMPLLVGLFDSSAARRSMDAPNAHELSDGSQYDLEELAAKQTAGGSLVDSIANMANSILGAGIIGLPYAISQAGFFMGLILLVILCAVTDWTIRLIVVNAKLSGRHSYIEIMDHCFGSSGRAAVSFFQFSFAFGGMCAFGIIIGDTIPHVVRSLFPSLPTIPILRIFANRKFIIVLCTVCVSYPLSLYRDIHKLSRASGVALIGMLIIVTSVIIEGPHSAPELRGDPSKRFTIIGPGIFQAIGVISFAFVCHHNSLLIYGSLRTPTLDRFAKVTHVSTLLSLVCCATLAISAYLVFTDKTQGNILNNFSPNDTLINVARFCFGLNMFTTLPLELFVCREVIEQYFFSHESYNKERHIFFTTTILLASTIVSLVTCDLGVMLEITGGVSATTLAYIFPAACYFKLLDHKIPWHSRTKLLAILCATFGVVVMTISLFLALGKSWTREGEPRMCM
ncbi:Vacuolar amino acid transporter 2 [Hypsizygus marmoreus]|uniref:Vacuolar amino acid transporter 2 n=1 Tax=Hypsizygus marmoreus TaxID=39966 RepID=A0A369J963_HYPMA|nr:Vacuolar amino acid transporter 2 [Hypsizygus marmoreus]